MSFLTFSLFLQKLTFQCSKNQLKILPAFTFSTIQHKKPIEKAGTTVP
jgi:hypothetical protein